jgi:hypothetical protein
MSAELLLFALLIGLIAMLVVLRHAESRRKRITMLADWLCLKAAARKARRSRHIVLDRS